MNNRIPWLNEDDYVVVDADWYLEKAYRLRKSLNDIVWKNIKRDGHMRVVFTSPQGQSIKLRRTYESQSWDREYPAHVQCAHHSDMHPVTFSSRRVKRVSLKKKDDDRSK